jgi:hypothetical protein
MPKGRYTIGAKGTHGCPGYPVVGDTGKVHGCHKDKASARAQQAAIYANESQKSYDGCCPEDNPFEKAQGPCWDGYEMVGYKTKNGKKVPNCVKVDSKKSTDSDDESGESHDKKKKKKLVKSDFVIVESHPRCEGPAIVDTEGTNVLCYGSMAEAQAALDAMDSEEEVGSMRPEETHKIWKGSGFDTRR